MWNDNGEEGDDWGKQPIQIKSRELEIMEKGEK
jgi:hypothetical protein